MLLRQPVAHGRFYPGRPDDLARETSEYLAACAPAEKDSRKPWAVMLPHAGYIFCGNIIGKTLAGTELAPRLVVLCPNHTGRGQVLGVWPSGAWLDPCGTVAVDENLAAQLIRSGGGFTADTNSHLLEHSIEVILPFLQAAEGAKLRGIVPVTVGTQNPQFLQHAGKALARVLALPENADAGVVVSSDMNHYESEKRTLEKDNMALESALAAAPDTLLETVAREEISMCGAGPLALALYAGQALGKLDVDLVAHDTSARASGDTEHTVGYAGLRLYLDRI